MGERPMERFCAYICADCDTDFGINELGFKLNEGTWGLKCPVCGNPTFLVYLIVTKDKSKDRPPHKKQGKN